MQLKQFYNIAIKVSLRKKCYYFWWSTWLISLDIEQVCIAYSYLTLTDEFLIPFNCRKLIYKAKRIYVFEDNLGLASATGISANRFVILNEGPQVTPHARQGIPTQRQPVCLINSLFELISKFQEPTFYNDHLDSSLALTEQILNRYHPHQDVMSWKRFPHYLPFVKGFHLTQAGDFFDLSVNNVLHKQSIYRWLQTLWSSYGEHNEAHVTPSRSVVMVRSLAVAPAFARYSASLCIIPPWV